MMTPDEQAAWDAIERTMLDFEAQQIKRLAGDTHKWLDGVHLAPSGPELFINGPQLRITKATEEWRKTLPTDMPVVLWFSPGTFNTAPAVIQWQLPGLVLQLLINLYYVHPVVVASQRPFRVELPDFNLIWTLDWDQVFDNCLELAGKDDRLYEVLVGLDPPTNTQDGVARMDAVRRWADMIRDEITARRKPCERCACLWWPVVLRENPTNGGQPRLCDRFCPACVPLYSKEEAARRARKSRRKNRVNPRKPSGKAV